MASFFHKVVATECLGEGDQNCPKFKNKERLPAYKNKCSACGGKAREIVELDPVKAGVAAVLSMALAGGGMWYVRAKVVGVASDAIRSGSGSTPQPGGGGGAGSQQDPSAQLSFSVELDRNGQRSNWVVGDFERSGATYRAKEALTKGDRARIEISYRSGRVYTFYRGAGDAMRFTSDAPGRVSIPSPTEWVQLDDKPGTEEFIAVGTDSGIPGLDALPAGSSFDPAVLEREIQQAGNRAAVMRIQIPHR